MIGHVSTVHVFHHTERESVKNTELWRTLGVPGQVVGDGIEEELSCLLPLIVKLLLVTGEQHTMQCYFYVSVITLFKQ